MGQESGRLTKIMLNLMTIDDPWDHSFVNEEH